MLRKKQHYVGGLITALTDKNYTCEMAVLKIVPRDLLKYVLI